MPALDDLPVSPAFFPLRLEESGSGDFMGAVVRRSFQAEPPPRPGEPPVGARRPLWLAGSPPEPWGPPRRRLAPRRLGPCPPRARPLPPVPSASVPLAPTAQWQVAPIRCPVAGAGPGAAPAQGARDPPAQYARRALPLRRTSPGTRRTSGAATSWSWNNRRTSTLRVGPPGGEGRGGARATLAQGRRVPGA